jgi:hypothetical protein
MPDPTTPTTVAERLRESLETGLNPEIRGSRFAADLRTLLCQHAARGAALAEIAELEGDCEQQKFRLTRFQASQIAREALASTTK